MADLTAVDFSDPDFEARLAASDKGELPPGTEIKVVPAKEPKDEIEVDVSERPAGKVAPGSAAKLAPIKNVQADTGDDDSEGIGTLRAQLEREKAARKAAEDRDKARETELNAARAEGDRWRSEAETSRYNEIVTAIGNVSTKLADLSSQWKAAMADGDFDKGAAVNMQILELQAVNIKLQEGKVAMEAEAQRPKAPADPVEAYLVKNGIKDPRSQAWVRAHPEVATDPAKSRAVLRAHNAFLGEHDESDVGTPAYYAFIEQRAGYGAPKAEADTESEVEAGDSPLSEAGRTSERTGTPPAAPPSRAGSVDIARKEPRISNKVTLSAAEREMAKLSGLTDIEYAQNKLALIKEGRYGTGT